MSWTVDGHDEIAIDDAITQLWQSSSAFCRCVDRENSMGKGVPFMENNNILALHVADSETMLEPCRPFAGASHEKPFSETLVRLAKEDPNVLLHRRSWLCIKALMNSARSARRNT